MILTFGTSPGLPVPQVVTDLKIVRVEKSNGGDATKQSALSSQSLQPLPPLQPIPHHTQEPIVPMIPGFLVVSVMRVSSIVPITTVVAAAVGEPAGLLETAEPQGPPHSLQSGLVVDVSAAVAFSYSSDGSDCGGDNG